MRHVRGHHVSGPRGPVRGDCYYGRVDNLDHVSRLIALLAVGEPEGVASTVPDLRVLDRPVMTSREAARQLRIPSATLAYWLEGGTRRDQWYEPILRPEPTGDTAITWGEMVEARYLRAYRNNLRVSMQRLRPFVAALREEFGVPYPLAHFKPWVDTSRRLILELQTASDLPTELRLVFQVDNGQAILNPLLEADFLARVDFAEGGEQEAQRIRPMGKKSPVVLDPRVSSAASTVRGIRTEILAEQVDAGAPVEDVAQDFDLPLDVLRAALAYEWETAEAV
jgi:uncharacterized protein (DUF433 family)